MKKLFAMLLLSIAVLASCSEIEQMSDSLNYVSEAADYINDVNQFANELPAAVEAASQDLNSVIQLEELLTEMQTEIEGYNGLEAPAMLEDIHHQVVEHNQELTSDIKIYLKNIEAETLSPELLEETGLMETLAVYNDLLNEMKELSGE